MCAEEGVCIVVDSGGWARIGYGSMGTITYGLALWRLKWARVRVRGSGARDTHCRLGTRDNARDIGVRIVYAPAKFWWRVSGKWLLGLGFRYYG